MDKEEPFVLVEDALTLLDVLKLRLPESAHVYNMAKMHSRFFGIMKFYTLFGDTSNKCWILSTYPREDVGVNILISAPPKENFTEEIKDAFKKSSIFKWNYRYVFAAIERRLSSFIIELSHDHAGNFTYVNPNYFYYMDFKDVENLNLSYDKESIEIKSLSLDSELGANFIVDTWKFSQDGTKEYVKKLIEKNESAGLFYKGELVSGVVFNNNGMIGMLYTNEKYRNKGFATLCLKYLMKELANNGFYPISAAEIKNTNSNKFHESLGFIPLYLCDYIRHLGRTY